MPSELGAQANHQANDEKNEKANSVNVAVAVIHCKDQYLLGFRNAVQHQGNRYEFVGGKIDAGESAEQALIREVEEETGIAIANNKIVKLGRLHHDYGDKQVSLQVYQCELNAKQYQQYQHCQYGLEGQALIWVSKADLLAGQYQLPAANKTILEWLALPPQIAITYPLAYFNADSKPEQAWLQYHQRQAAPESWLYVRLKEANAKNIAAQLLEARPDLKVIIPFDIQRQHLVSEGLSMSKNRADNSTDVNRGNHQADNQIVAYHLTHTLLMQWFDDDESVVSSLLQTNLPLTVSCHDAASIKVANKLANTRLQQQLPSVIGAFLSPVLATQTHPDVAPLGWASWSELAQLADMPVIGLGGVSPMMIEQALQHGGVSVAGIRQFL